MTDRSEMALLPAGLADKLPPAAAHEAVLIDSLIACFGAHGYQRVSPPLVEFEENLLRDADADMAADTFRIMDPVSQRMMGLRSDMTMQVARIAASRLRLQPRPLRLCYAGDVLRVRGTQLRPERQFAQVGAELIGAAGEAADVRADVEMITLAAEGLAALGIDRISIDVGSPSLLRSVFHAFDLDPEELSRIRDALDHKDVAAVSAHANSAAPLLSRLLDAAGPAQAALEALAAIDLPDAARRDADRLAEVVGLVAARSPDLTLTVDPVENRGFEYHTASSFTIFAAGVRGELGRGGRYVAGHDRMGDEPGTGFSLFMDSVMRARPETAAPGGVFLPVGTTSEDARRLRAEGWITVAGLDAEVEPVAEARRLGCSHVFQGNAAVSVEG
ncbi:MAG: ATP phosphoribosyltransferase regulatory subunit [Alphaproteobacteria bacterium]|nr:ATP phosphoribosyltransferase regulatory subunit [Alphaproteobacteria bacterium]